MSFEMNFGVTIFWDIFLAQSALDSGEKCVWRGSFWDAKIGILDRLEKQQKSKKSF
ncbi:unnamed protein product [Amoebophrya sp. A25]|nr:unnamed protein product [Amoebophrya sp. A25]|eukprot:GSA25T00008946001.1